ncbi:MAG: DUF7486 family protein [Thermodesulfobacteriota bacterium]
MIRNLLFLSVIVLGLNTLYVNASETIWHVKAIQTDGKTLDIKAFDKKGMVFDVKAIQEDSNMWIIDVKAIIDGKKVPVKILVSDDKYAPVKAIGSDGTIFDIKAIAPNGDKLDVKGVDQTGNIHAIKVVGPKEQFYSVKAISPMGEVYDIKGIKITDKEIESLINGIPIHAHVKALPPVHGLVVFEREHSF